jgi:hypothetical protein
LLAGTRRQRKGNARRTGRDGPDGKAHYVEAPASHGDGPP